MNANDPQLTAFALDELDPLERAQIEQFLRENPQAVDEVKSIRAVGHLLGATLRTEPAEALSPEHRKAVLEVGSRKAQPLKVVAGPSWWGSWQFAATAAACMVFGFGTYAIFDALTKPRAPYAAEGAKAGGLEIGVPSADAELRSMTAAADSAPAHPNALRISSGAVPFPITQPRTSSKVQIARADIDAQLKPPTPLPEITVTPEPAPQVAAAPKQPAVHRGGTGVAPMAAFSRPVAVATKGASGPSYDSAVLNVTEKPALLMPLTFGPDRYAEISRALHGGKLPAKELVDVHSLINGFNLPYQPPVNSQHPVALYAEVGPLPLSEKFQLLKVTVQARTGSGELVAQNASVEVEFNSQRLESYAFLGKNTGLGSQSGADLLAGQTATAMCFVFPKSPNASEAHALLTVKLRYTAIGESGERSIIKTVARPETSFERCSPQFRMAGIVASAGWLFNGGALNDPKAWSKLRSVSARSRRTMAVDKKSEDFLDLVRLAAEIVESK